MKVSAECIACILGCGIELLNRQLPAEKHEAVIRKFLACTAQQDWSNPPPELAEKVYLALREHGGTPDSFAEAKRLSTELALQLLPEMRSIIAGASDRFNAIIHAVIGGNIIDCGADRTLVIPEAIAKLHDVFAMPLETELVRQFEKRFYQAKNLLYILDNCGEAVFDRLLLEEFPGKVTLAVRGDYILNDITRHELAASGLGNYTVVDSQTATPGVPLPRLPEAYRQALESADLVISKGQGNYETLEGRLPNPTAFLLRIKCPVVSRSMQKPHGALALHLENF